MRLRFFILFFFVIFFALIFASAPPALAQLDLDGLSGESGELGGLTDDFDPPNIEDFISIEKEKNFEEEANELPFDIKGDAQKEAALSYGARGGLAWRTWHIRQELEERARYLDKVFDFRQLLIPAPSGLLIEPPIVSQSLDAMIIDGKGIDAAVADRVLLINRNARIVSAPRTWRAYLERQWGDTDAPPDVLRPADKEERKVWEKNIREGWQKGVEQADEIFQQDLNQLVGDYQGMIRYRTLLAQGMISPPYALQVDRGVTGGGDEMRIGDRAVSLTELPKLQTRYKQWQPANR
ncbi:MAG: type IV secretion system DotC family protein [Alphaproteobacteria bacterium]|nr:type IV secretion system DotC family protein [Alphaproteobacteria bacterium]